MKKLILSSFLLLCSLFAFSQSYVVECDSEVMKEQPGPHGGGGMSLGFSFFDKVSDYPMAFKKRVLKPGSSIGYHLQKKDEIYYILSGEGEMQMNGKSFTVKAGDCILTRPGSSHGLKPKGEMAIIIMYEK